MDITAWLWVLRRCEMTFRENEIGAEILPKPTADELKDIGAIAVGHRRKLLEAIATFRKPLLAQHAEPGVIEVAARGAKSTEADRRQSRVLFCDLDSSTELSISGHACQSTR